MLGRVYSPICQIRKLSLRKVKRLVHGILANAVWDGCHLRYSVEKITHIPWNRVISGHWEMTPLGSRLPGENECATYVWMGQAHMRKWGLMMLPRDSLWPELVRSWSGVGQIIRFSTYQLLVVIRVFQYGNNPACWDNLGGESQKDWGTFCKALPASIQMGSQQSSVVFIQQVPAFPSFPEGQCLWSFFGRRNICLNTFAPPGLHSLWGFSRGSLGPLDIAPLSFL